MTLERGTSDTPNRGPGGGLPKPVHGYLWTRPVAGCWHAAWTGTSSEPSAGPSAASVAPNSIHTLHSIHTGKGGPVYPLSLTTCYRSRILPFERLSNVLCTPDAPLPPLPPTPFHMLLWPCPKRPLPHPRSPVPDHNGCPALCPMPCAYAVLQRFRGAVAPPAWPHCLVGPLGLSRGEH